MFVCDECFVLSGRGLCDELITRPEQSRLWCVVVCDLETSRTRGSWPALGRRAMSLCWHHCRDVQFTNSKHSMSNVENWNSFLHL